MEVNEKYSLTNILFLIEASRETIARFGDSFFIYEKDVDYQNSFAFNLMQIGEVIRYELSSEFKEAYSDLSWDSFRLLRNDLAHNYDSLDLKEVWGTVKNDLESLQSYVEFILAQK